jgi:Tfp pilus assembly protein PilP
MRRILATIVALLLATVALRAQTPAPAAGAKPAAAQPPTTPAAAKPAPTPAAQAPAPKPAAAPAPASPAPAAKPGATPTPAPPAAASTPAAAAATPGQPAAPGPPQAENFSYAPDGRRDPFLNLIGTGATDTRGASGRRADGPAGMSVNEISVRGVVQGKSGLIAMVQGPDNKTYIVHPGDRLLDGSIKSITPTGLVVIQEVHDPLSLVKQREVSKLLRSLEGVK